MEGILKNQYNEEVELFNNGKKEIVQSVQEILNDYKKGKSLRDDIEGIFSSAFQVETAKTEESIDEVYKLRYQVYCVDKPFEDPTCFLDGREHDQYDFHSAHGVVRHKKSKEVAAVVRLVLSKSKGMDFPMEEPCLKLMSEEAQNVFRDTARSSIAELSRFAVSRAFRRRLNEFESIHGFGGKTPDKDDYNSHRAMPYISLGLFAAIVELSVEHGITHWMAVMEPTLLRLLKRYGIEFDYIGRSVEYHGVRKPVFTDARVLLEKMRNKRLDVWQLITSDGKYLP